MFGRFIERRATEALSDTPVVLIVGPRRAGKTTLVRKMGNADRTYITLDDQTVLAAAQSDQPYEFEDGHEDGRCACTMDRGPPSPRNRHAANSGHSCPER